MENKVIMLGDPEAFLQEIENRIEKKLQQHKQNEIEARYLSPEEACSIFKPSISRGTLRNWTDQGLIESYQIGGKIWYRYNDVIEAVERIKKFHKKTA